MCAELRPVAVRIEFRLANTNCDNLVKLVRLKPDKPDCLLRPCWCILTQVLFALAMLVPIRGFRVICVGIHYNITSFM